MIQDFQDVKRGITGILLPSGGEAGGCQALCGAAWRGMRYTGGCRQRATVRRLKHVANRRGISNERDKY